MIELDPSEVFVPKKKQKKLTVEQRIRAIAEFTMRDRSDSVQKRLEDNIRKLLKEVKDAHRKQCKKRE